MAIYITRRIFTTSGLLFFLTSGERAKAEGADTSFESLLQKLEADENLSINVIGHDELSETLVPGLETAPIRAPKSSTPISDRAIKLIVASEVSSQSTYNQKYLSPIWPQGHSGVTIGIGYDIGYVKPKELEIDWRNYITADQILSLQPACDEKGPDARDILPTIAPIKIAWANAYAQFKNEMIPRYVGLVERSLENTSALNSDSLGALVSLVYNRGASFNLKGDRFLEMRQISDAMEAENLAVIPGYLRSMKRIWGPKASGLWIRRDAEAELFELGRLKKG